MKRICAGFTLIELVITILVTAIIGAVAAYGITNGVLAFQSTSEAMDTIGKLRVSAERLARELRELRRDPSDITRYDITEPFSSTQIGFVKNDGTTVDIATAASTVTLAYNAPAGTFTLTDQLSSLTFSYYQDDGVNPATGADTLAFIEYDLVLSDAGGVQHAERIRVGLRNQQ